MLNHFRFIPFLIGIVVGYIISIIYKPEKQTITQYPHPNQSKDKVYKDKNGTCYTYTSHEVNCDANEKTLKDFPIQ
jgi:hypothetical protein